MRLSSTRHRSCDIEFRKHSAEEKYNFFLRLTEKQNIKMNIQQTLEGEQTNLTLGRLSVDVVEKKYFFQKFLVSLSLRFGTFILFWTLEQVAAYFKFTSKQLEVSLLTEIHFLVVSLLYPCFARTFALATLRRRRLLRLRSLRLQSLSHVASVRSWTNHLYVGGKADGSDGAWSKRERDETRFLTLLIQSLILFYVDS